jgi:hypothetical protein
MEQETLKVKLNKNGVPHRGGAPKKKPFAEQLVMTYAFVKRKHHGNFQKMIKEMALKYR